MSKRYYLNQIKIELNKKENKKLISKFKKLSICTDKLGRHWE